jgi:N-acylneuraminate cytidylyltransferase
MTNVASSPALAIIPARGGSQRIPRKNLWPLAGAPLVVHSIRHALAARAVAEVVVSTDDDEIAEISRAAGATVRRRPAAIADGKASSESALIDVLDDRLARGLADADLVVFLQCTSPIRGQTDIDDAVETLLRHEADSLLSVCRNSRYIWMPEGDTHRSVNYDFRRRQMEQDLPPQWQENGSIYITRTPLLRQWNNRLGGTIAVHEMDYWSSFQVDDPDDLALVDWILWNRVTRFPKPLPGVRLLVLDFDGVMTDNRVWLDDAGRELVACDRGDGWGVARLRETGFPVAVVSTERNGVVAARCRKLGLECRQDVADKPAAVRELAAAHGVPLDEVAYLGNDVNDLPAMLVVGTPVAVADAHPDVIRAAKRVLTAQGGRGAVREICDMLLAAQSPPPESRP